jgi:hypothetical protein
MVNRGQKTTVAFFFGIKFYKTVRLVLVLYSQVHSVHFRTQGHSSHIQFHQARQPVVVHEFVSETRTPHSHSSELLASCCVVSLSVLSEWEHSLHHHLSPSPPPQTLVGISPEFRRARLLRHPSLVVANASGTCVSPVPSLPRPIVVLAVSLASNQTNAEVPSTSISASTATVACLVTSFGTFATSGAKSKLANSLDFAFVLSFP